MFLWSWLLFLFTFWTCRVAALERNGGEWGTKMSVCLRVSGELVS